MEPQEFIVKDVFPVSEFVDAEIGTDYEINSKEDIVIFDLTPKEYKRIRQFITNNYLWGKIEE